MFNKFTKATAIMVLPMAALLVLTGCDEEEPAAPAAEQVNLSQTEDLFSDPVQPNPLASDPNTVVVRVNGDEITRGEITELINANLQQMAARGIPPQQLEQMKNRLVSTVQDQLITKRLMDAAIATSDIEVSDEDVSAEVTKLRESFDLRSNTDGGTLETALAAQGTSIEEVSASIKEQLAAQKFLESKVEGIADATEAEAQTFYDENPDQFNKPEGVTASHILISFDEGDTDEAKAEKKTQLEKVRADIIAETVTFEDAAKENSSCPSSAKGGSLGTFGKGRMVPEFEIAAFSQEIDEVGEIIETSFGYHVIKVTERQEAGVVSFEEAKEQIVSYLTNQKKQEAISSFIKSLRDSATIEMVPAP